MQVCGGMRLGSDTNGDRSEESVPMRRIITACVLLIAPGVATAQSVVDASVPRTSWGAPDLQGVWDFRSITPMERPEEFAGREFLTEEEAAKLEQDTVDENERLLNRPAQRTKVTNSVEEGDDGAPGFYNNFWLDWGTATVETRRTSLIIDPPDGRIPPLAVSAEEAHAATAELRQGLTMHQPTPGGWVDDLGNDGLQVRCLTGFNSGPPMTLAGFNSNVQVFQTPDYVVLLNELNHDSRIVPLDGRPNIELPQWLGNSRGRWEGDTLLVETTDFLRETSFASGQTDSELHLTERFTRVSPTTLMYEATINDPTVWSQSWAYHIPMRRSDLPVFETACHEGNRSLYNILAGARAKEAATGAEPQGSR